MTVTLGNVCEAIVDCEHKTALAGDGYALSVGTRAMKNGRLVLDACKPVSESTYDVWTRRMRPRPGDLILAREAPVGQVIRVPENPRVCLGQRTVLIRPDPARVLPRFLHYWLLGPDAQATMAAQAAGATVAHLNVEDIRNLDVSRLPTDPQLQGFVASTLGALDDLVENGRRRIALLQQMAHAIYQEWFVRFRYPGHEESDLVPSPLGSIPEGWEVRSLFDVADVGFGFSFKSVRFGPGGLYPVVRIRDVRAGTTRTFTDEEPAERYRVVDGDILIGMDGDFHLRQWTGGEAWLNQRVARLRPSGEVGARHLLLAIEKSIKAWNVAITGTTVAHLGKRHLQEVQVVVPLANAPKVASEAIAGAADQERILAQSNRRLEAIRDLLLPRLVAGQLAVSEMNVDALVESIA